MFADWFVNSSIVMPFRYWQETEGYVDIVDFCDIWTNGEFDPWSATSMSSEIRPGGPLPVD